MKKVYKIDDHTLQKRMNSIAEHHPSEFFADDVMDRIFKEQSQRLHRPTLKDLILAQPIFRYALVGGLLLYPTLVRAFLQYAVVF